MIEITISQAEVSIGTDAVRGIRVLVVGDKQSGIRVVIPMDRLAAVKIGQMLSSGVDMPSSLPIGKDN